MLDRVVHRSELRSEGRGARNKATLSMGRGDVRSTRDALPVVLNETAKHTDDLCDPLVEVGLLVLIEEVQSPGDQEHALNLQRTSQRDLEEPHVVLPAPLGAALRDVVRDGETRLVELMTQNESVLMRKPMDDVVKNDHQVDRPLPDKKMSKVAHRHGKERAYRGTDRY